MAKKQKRAIQMRLSDDVIGRIDEVADLMGMSRAGYCAYIMETMHGEQFNPMKVAEDILERQKQRYSR